LAMLFKETRVKGAFVVELEKRGDDRGFFARAFCRKEFEAQGLDFNPVQANVGASRLRGTLRGLHYQVRPHEEKKLVRCTAGALFDVVVDLRSGSPSCKQWFGVELTAENHKMLYVPEGCAHGYLTLADRTEIFYLVSEFYSPGAERGVRWNDPAFGIDWPPVEALVMSEKDAGWPDFADQNLPQQETGFPPKSISAKTEAE
jgi:dTDP-4-dehydrorhamnose 3,5-epimerase